MQVGIPSATAFILVFLVIVVMAFFVGGILYPNILNGILKALGLLGG